MQLSQEDLAEKIYVSRQTISNWETGKNYPDIHSLLRLSSLFNVSLDQLVKGDVELMKEEIKKTEIKKFRQHGIILGILFIVAIASLALHRWIGFYALIPFGILSAIAMLVALKTETIKTENRTHTYQEILEFVGGTRLDELERHIQIEKGKRHNQVFLLAVGGLLIVVSIALYLFLR